MTEELRIGADCRVCGRRQLEHVGGRCPPFPPKVTPKVTPLGQKRNDLQALVNHIKAVVHGYDGRISVTEAIGALEIAKLEIYEGQK
jgi:hypothetical protein